MAEKDFLKNVVADTVMTRRSFMKWSAALGGSAVLASGVTGLPAGQPNGKASAQTDTEVFWSSCNVNCGSRCPLRLHVRDGVVVRVEVDNVGSDEFGTDESQVRSCVRGRSIRQRLYDPDRLKYPMRRVGQRGSGEFERITWEEAFDEIADKLQAVLDEYGNEAVYINYATGALGGTVSKSWPPASTPMARLMNLVGGYLNHYGTYSAAQIGAAGPYTYGSGFAANSIEDIVNSKLVVMFGNNPAATRMSGGGIVYVMQQLKAQSDVKVIVIDPRLSDSVVSMADEWVPIRPGTDAALVNALAYVLITEDLHDQDFLDTYCVGFDEDHMPEGVESGNSYKDYILGDGPDGTPKTPEWAAAITGIPAERIIRLAREIGTAKPAYIMQGWGPQRQANGEQNTRAIFMLPILTGNVGIQGGNPGTREGSFGLGVTAFPTGSNPVDTSISVFMWPDAILRGPEMTATADGVQGKDQLDVPIKFIWNYAGNCLINQHSDTNGTAELLADDSLCEMIVVIENHMTSSAKFADILLPDITTWEQDDIAPGSRGGHLGYAIFASKAVDPMYECMSVYEMCTEIAKRLGVEEEYTEGRTQDEWLQWVVEQTRENNPDFPDYDSFKEMGVYKIANPGEPAVAFKSFRENPEENPLSTPSGMIEIFSERLHEIAQTWELPEGDLISGLPMYAPTWEGVEDPLRDTYPLQMIGHHYKQRTHSTYGNSEWMKEVAPQEVWINTLDAEARGIQQGDMVDVFNERGRIQLPAKVTTRMMPGVVSVPQGAWYAPNNDGVDVGGCVNTLTKYHPSPLAKANPQHTNLVEVEKA
jgi:anaerobic dimethyl sulfoxide reductase subunit A